MTLPEVLLWQALRQRPDGLKFRRQQAAGRYIADFYCHAAQLSVEVDGAYHDRGDRPERDSERDANFARLGVRVLRIPAREVLGDIEAVVRHIVDVAGSAFTAPPACGWSPSPQGEEWKKGE